MLELLRGGDADPAVAAIAAVLSRVAATLIVIVILLVLRMALALLTLLLTSLALTPLGRPVVAEGLDECRRPVGLAEDCDGLHCNVDRDESEHTNARLQRFTQDAPFGVCDQPLADARFAQAERGTGRTGCALEQPVDGSCTLHVVVVVVKKALKVHLVQPLDGLQGAGSMAAIRQAEDDERCIVNLELGVHARHDPLDTLVHSPPGNTDLQCSVFCSSKFEH